MLDQIAAYALRINELLTAYLKEVNIELIDFKLEFGITNDGQLVLADEISPDTCRFWDTRTGEKLDKDRFPPRFGQRGRRLHRNPQAPDGRIRISAPRMAIDCPGRLCGNQTLVSMKEQ